MSEAYSRPFSPQQKCHVAELSTKPGGKIETSSSPLIQKCRKHASHFDLGPPLLIQASSSNGHFAIKCSKTKARDSKQSERGSSIRHRSGVLLRQQWVRVGGIRVRGMKAVCIVVWPRSALGWHDLANK